MSTLQDDTIESLLTTLNNYSSKIPSLRYTIVIDRISRSTVRYVIKIKYINATNNKRSLVVTSNDLNDALIKAIVLIEERITFVSEVLNKNRLIPTNLYKMI